MSSIVFLQWLWVSKKSMFLKDKGKGHLSHIWKRIYELSHIYGNVEACYLHPGCVSTCNPKWGDLGSVWRHGFAVLRTGRAVLIVGAPALSREWRPAPRRRVGRLSPCSGGAQRVRPATEQRSPPSLGGGGTTSPLRPCRPSSQPCSLPTTASPNQQHNLFSIFPHNLFHLYN